LRAQEVTGTQAAASEEPESSDKAIRGSGKMNRMRDQRREEGAVIVTVALSLFLLLGFIGLALDFSRLFIIKTELQTALDSCALAAAAELDGTTTATTRARNAGKAAGNMNNVAFQSATAGIVDGEVTFSDTLNGTYSTTFDPLTAKYAKCSHVKSDIAPWMFQFLKLVTGNTAYAANQVVGSQAVATRAPSQSTCAIPVAIYPKGTGTNFGFTPGEWIPTLYDGTGTGTSDTTPGHFGWANLDGTARAKSTKDELAGTGVCNLSVGTTSTPGAKFAAALYWNARFGLYKNGAGNPDINSSPPDLTGYSYYTKNWSPTTGNALPDYLVKRNNRYSYGGTTDTVSSGNSITGLNIGNPPYKDSDMATYAAGPNALATHGQDRRLVLAPVISGGAISAFACVLILHPIDSNSMTVYLEYVGNASAPGSPCPGSGLPGGTGTPLVPVLVQ
jgi:Flp pilus assembly protein TadG